MNIKNKFQIYNFGEVSNFINALKTAKYNCFYRKSSRLHNKLIHKESFSFKTKDNVFYFLQGLIYDKDLKFLGGYAELNRFVKKFLSMNVYFELPTLILKQETPKEIVKLLSSLKMNYSLLAESLFNDLTNAKVQVLALSNSELNTIISSFLSSFGNISNIEYTEQGIQIISNAQNTIEELRASLLETDVTETQENLSEETETLFTITDNPTIRIDTGVQGLADFQAAIEEEIETTVNTEEQENTVYLPPF